MELRYHYHLPLLFSPPSPPVTFPAIQMRIKTPSGFLYYYLFTDEDKGLGRNGWINMLTIEICPKEVRASGVSLSIKMQEPSHIEAFRGSS